MNPIKIVVYIVAAIIIFFGVLFLWGAFSPQGSSGWIFIGLITVGIGLILIWFASSRLQPANEVEKNISLNIDLPGTVNLDKLLCQNCGGVIATKDISMVAGAPVVNCPYCGTTYQLTEEPKW